MPARFPIPHCDSHGYYGSHRAPGYASPYLPDFTRCPHLVAFTLPATPCPSFARYLYVPTLPTVLPHLGRIHHLHLVGCAIYLPLYTFAALVRFAQHLVSQTTVPATQVQHYRLTVLHVATPCPVKFMCCLTHTHTHIFLFPLPVTHFTATTRSLRSALFGFVMLYF